MSRLLQLIVLAASALAAAAFVVPASLHQVPVLQSQKHVAAAIYARPAASLRAAAPFSMLESSAQFSSSAVVNRRRPAVIIGATAAAIALSCVLLRPEGALAALKAAAVATPEAPVHLHIGQRVANYCRITFK
jgi:hypothetical protein